MELTKVREEVDIPPSVSSELARDLAGGTASRFGLSWMGDFDDTLRGDADLLPLSIDVLVLPSVGELVSSGAVPAERGPSISGLAIAEVSMVIVGARCRRVGVGGCDPAVVWASDMLSLDQSDCGKGWTISTIDGRSISRWAVSANACLAT